MNKKRCTTVDLTGVFNISYEHGLTTTNKNCNQKKQVIFATSQLVKNHTVLSHVLCIMTKKIHLMRAFVPACLRARVPACLRARVPACLRACVPECLRVIRACVCNMRLRALCVLCPRANRCVRYAPAHLLARLPCSRVHPSAGEWRPFYYYRKRRTVHGNRTPCAQRQARTRM